MKLTTLLAHTGLLCVAFAASPSFTEPLGHEWIAPTSKDSRSSCPGLNSMANHGWLPHSGKNIDLAALQHAVKGAFNFAPDALDETFQAAVDFKLTTTGNSSTINLGDLDLHDAIEFDGSISRNDFFLGDNTHFDPVVWASTANRLGLHDSVETEADKFVTIEKAAVARALRVQDAMRANPRFNASAAQQQRSPGTTGLYLAALWNETAGAAPKTWVMSFFEQEHIPYLLGFDPQARAEQSSQDIAAVVSSILQVNVMLGGFPISKSERSGSDSRNLHGFRWF
ncbi:Cloroperoxidase [Cladorrhinum sp. PSN332]|nr:Cloroperoxidase [Cladorrhinum sp. PSN332]